MATLDKPNEFKVIGTSPLRHDGVDKVTGRAAYGADILLPAGRGPSRPCRPRRTGDRPP